MLADQLMQELADQLLGTWLADEMGIGDRARDGLAAGKHLQLLREEPAPGR